MEKGRRRKNEEEKGGSRGGGKKGKVEVEESAEQKEPASLGTTLF